MSLPLKEHEITSLIKRFGIPDLVSEWIDDTTAFHDANEYVLHESLSNMHPEDALLCIVLCLRSLSAHQTLPESITLALEPIISNVMNYYGHGALQRFKDTLSGETRENIECVAQDLAKLNRTLENIEPYLFELNNEALNVIISALSIQTGAQAEIAKYVLVNCKEQEQRLAPIAEQDSIPFLKTLPVNDNLVRE